MSVSLTKEAPGLTDIAVGLGWAVRVVSSDNNAKVTRFDLGEDASTETALTGPVLPLGPALGR